MSLIDWGIGAGLTLHKIWQTLITFVESTYEQCWVAISKVFLELYLIPNPTTYQRHLHFFWTLDSLCFFTELKRGFVRIFSSCISLRVLLVVRLVRLVVLWLAFLEIFQLCGISWTFYVRCACCKFYGSSAYCFHGYVAVSIDGNW